MLSLDNCGGNFAAPTELQPTLFSHNHAASVSRSVAYDLEHLKRVARILKTSRPTPQEQGTAITAPVLQESLQDALLAAQQEDAFFAQQKQLFSAPNSTTGGELSLEV